MDETQIEKLPDKLPEYVDSLLTTFRRKRVLLILLQLKKHKKLRNKELAKKLGGVSPSTLSSLLKQLCQEGLIQRKVFGEIPPLKTEYSLTKIGKDFLQAIHPLLKWLLEKQY